MNTQPSRRRFLQKGCLVAAAAGVTLCGGGAFAATYQPGVDFPSSISAEGGAGERVLLAYASKAGSTAEVAMRMGEILSGRNYRVDVQPVKDVGDLIPYQAVILGSAIRTGSILPEAMAFIENNQATLQARLFSIYVLCMTLQQDNPETRKTVSAYPDPVRVLVKPVREGLFAGNMDLNKLKLIERLIIKAMQAPEGDFRDWGQIDSWTRNI